MAKKTFSGQCGIVLLPDLGTTRSARYINEDFNLRNAVTEEGLDLSKHIPHFSLYHARFKDLPFSVAKRAVDRIKGYLPLSFNLYKLNVYGDNFLFWDVDPDDVQLFMRLYEEAIKLVHFLDRSRETQADKEGLKLTPQERENLLLYGHPLVKDLLRPHLTVGYLPHGILSINQPYRDREAKILRVAFAKIGELGTIQEIIYQL